MAFPVDAARINTNGSAAATNKVCNLPTGIASGHLLILVLRSNAADTHTTPTGWSDLVKNDVSDGSDDVVSIFRKIADGGEGATVTVNGTASLKFTAVAWRITGHDSVTVPVISAVAFANSAAPDPPSLTPAGGAKDFLWLWVGTWEGEQADPSGTPPTNYANAVYANSGTGGAITTNSRSLGYSRQVNAATEDPPAESISVADDWMCWTIAIYPVPPAELNAEPGSYAITGAAAEVLVGRFINAIAGSYGVTGVEAVLQKGFFIIADPGAYAVAGFDATIIATRLLSADPGAYGITGADATLTKGFTINAESGAYTIAGFNATLLATRLLSADPGTYVLSGVNASLLVGRLLGADPGIYAVTGSDAAVLIQRMLSADPGAYVVSGVAASLLVGRLLVADVGSYVITGAAAELLRGLVLSANPGVYTLVGTDATLVYVPAGGGAFVLIAEPGSYALTGAAAELLVGRFLSANPGLYVVTGVDASVLATRLLSADPGIYVLIGREAFLIRPGTSVKLFVATQAKLVASPRETFVGGRREIFEAKKEN